MRAIQHSASNYILKPIDIYELIASVHKVKEGKNNKLNNTSILLENLKNTDKQSIKIVLPVLEGLEIIKTEEIIHCEANDNFTKFHLDGGKQMLICRTLKHYQQILEPLNFVRIHKSHLVNLEKVTRYIKGKGGLVCMSNNIELPVSPTKKAGLLEGLMG